MRSFVPIIMLLALASGCARYEYDLVQPADLSRRIGRDLDAVVQVEPLEYRMRSVENRLVIRIFNPTDEMIQLLGERSSVVDPDGQSHPLRGGPIAPRSFLKLIIPPPRPVVYSPGPRFGVGVGMRVNRFHHRPPYYHSYFYDPYWGHHLYDHYAYDPWYYDQPRYLAVHDASDTFYWEWRGEGEARLNLLFQQGEKEFRHEFMFRRRKV